MLFNYSNKASDNSGTYGQMGENLYMAIIKCCKFGASAVKMLTTCVKL